ncbi:MAG: reverse transcriptase family protein [Planctomycetes bacterium]|nr:reverse transcriptase family protein [Planctomycetota bacterium]
MCVANKPNPKEPFLSSPEHTLDRRHRKRWAGLAYRRKRSKWRISPVADQSIEGCDWRDKLGNVSADRVPQGVAGRVATLGLPAINSVEDLAALIGITPNQLAGFALRGDGQRSHYVGRPIPKKSGGERRLLVPLPRLKAAQQALHRKLISLLPLQPCVHGFRLKHDVLTGSSVHVGRQIVIGMDIAEFFPSFTFRRVSGYFRALGYSRGIAIALASLTITSCMDVPDYTPEAYSNHSYTELPQGAPTSPGIANAICWRMDKRLSALARKFGGDYTRYADDLTFSGFQDMADNTGRLLRIVRQIIETEGFVVNENKTRIMRRGSQQRVTGVVVNEKTNLPRREFDKIKAIIHNCIKHGPATQNHAQHENFKEHLRGRVAHAQHIGPERGQKLKAMFDSIVW